MSDDNSDDQQPEDPLTEVIARLRRDGADFFLNSTLEPTISIREDYFQQVWPANSERVRDLVLVTYYDLTRQPIDGVEMKQLMAMLREECRVGGRRATEIEAMKAEEQAIVQGILCLLNGRESYVGRTATLLQLLQDLQAHRKITDADRLTPLVNVFSRRLKRLIPTLRGFHVAGELTHREDGSHCSLRRLDGFEREPEAAPRIAPSNDDTDAAALLVSSVGSRDVGRDLGPSDAADGNFRFE